MRYHVIQLAVRPGTTPAALSKLETWLAETGAVARLLACWFTEIGALNQILLIFTHDPAGDPFDRAEVAQSDNPFGLAGSLTGWSADTFVSLPFVEPMRPGSFGPYFEARTYLVMPDRMGKTVELWRKVLPGRLTLSPAIGVMHSLTGPVPRFLHIWPWDSLDGRMRTRARAVELGLWPPPGGPDHLIAQQVDIYLAAPFSPIR